MALIKCPECGKEISDKAKACIHCGYPLDELRTEQVLKEDTGVSNQSKFTIKIVDYKGSKVKVISILKQYLQYNTDEAKQLVTELPLVLELDGGDLVKVICTELTDAGILYEKHSDKENLHAGERTIKILDYKGSKVKVISILKFYFNYSMEDAKNAVLETPLFIKTDKEINALRNIAQELTDAGVVYEIYDGSEVVSIPVEVKDKIIKTTSFGEKAINEPIYKECPSCKKKYVFYNNDNAFYCDVCNTRLQRVDKTYATYKPTPEPPKYVPKCPTCQSPDIKKITNFEKAESLFWFGGLSRKARKQWHCNNCGSEW